MCSCHLDYRDPTPVAGIHILFSYLQNSSGHCADDADSPRIHREVSREPIDQGPLLFSNSASPARFSPSHD
jgi:hypothetical protein